MNLRIFSRVSTWLIPSLLCLSLFSGCSSGSAGKAVVWKLNNTAKIGDQPVVAHDNLPQVKSGVLHFNGVDEGLVVQATPSAGWAKFTIEMDILPEAGGLFEQRFFHAGSMDQRMMFELRSNPDGTWYLDTFLMAENGKRLALIDSTKTHASGRWYTVALVYDGVSMSNYVNGVKQGEGKVDFGILKPGVTSIGVRQNKVCWFKGMMREIRYYPEVRIPQPQSNRTGLRRPASRLRQPRITEK